MLLQTRDLQLAATLKCIGHKIIRIDTHRDGKSLVFIFTNEENKTQEQVNRYMGRELRIEPRSLFAAAGVLKSWIDQKKQNQKWKLNKKENHENNQSKTQPRSH